MEQTAAQKIRAQAKEATRRALLDAGLAETIDRGGDVPSIESICTRAGYTRGAFYVHFKDREHFINEMLDWILNDIIQSLFLSAADEATGIPDVIARFNELLLQGEWPDLHNNIRAGYLAILRELRPGSKVRDQHAQLMTGIAERLEQLIRQGQEAGNLRQDVDARDTAMLLLLTAIGSIVWDRVGIAVDDRVGATLVTLLAPVE